MTMLWGIDRSKGFRWDTIPGMHANALKGQKQDVSELVGLKIIKVGGQECIPQNVPIKMELSPLKKRMGRKTFLHAANVVRTSALPVKDMTLFQIV